MPALTDDSTHAVSLKPIAEDDFAAVGVGTKADRVSLFDDLFFGSTAR